MTEVSVPDNYVSLILDRKVRLKRVSPESVKFVQSLGGNQETISDEECWIIEYQDDHGLGELLGILRDHDFLFVGGPSGWSPSAIFMELREKGFVSGDCPEVIWLDKSQWITRNR